MAFSGAWATFGPITAYKVDRITVRVRGNGEIRVYSMTILKRISKTTFLSAWVTFGSITAYKVDRITVRVRGNGEIRVHSMKINIL
jgi:hypothetical protein